MAWKWVQKLKNDLSGEYTYGAPAITITDEIIAAAGTSTHRIGGTKENGRFDEAYAVIADLAGQGATRIDLLRENYDVFFYGLVGGTGIEHKINISSSGSFTFEPYKWTAFNARTRLSNVSGTFTDDTDKSKNVWYLGLLINDETEYAYLCAIHGSIYYPYYPEYFRTDSAYVDIYFFNGGRLVQPSHNLYSIVRGSIPGGGGGSAGPYDEGGISTGTDTGTGDFDETSDPVALPTLPSVSALSSGLISLYKVAQTEVSKFVGFLWSDSFSVASLSKIFSDPMQAIISFGMFPFDVSAGASVPIYLGKNNTGAVGDLVTAQYVTVPMGSVNLTEFYGGALDYNPYTKIQLVLPYCGVVNINPDEFMTKAVTVTYRVDILSGACVAFVSDGERVLQQVNGNCLVTLPYASTDFKQVYSSLLGLAGTAGAAIVAGATGGLTAPVVGGIGASLAMNTLNAKENYARGGAAGSTLGFLGVQTPYLVITRPRQCLPENNGHFQGYPLYTTERLGDLTGFTKVAQIHLDDIDATDSELKEIARLLTEGVIL